jgi:hypothetical protein
MLLVALGKRSRTASFSGPSSLSTKTAFLWSESLTAFAGGASPLKDAWTLTLGRDFPDRHFSVEFYDTPSDDPTDYQITFYQMRNNT